MKKFFVKALAVLLTCMFVISGINFSIFAGDAVNAGNLGDKLVAMNVALTGRVKMSFYFTNVEGNVDYYAVKVGNEEEGINADYQVPVGSMGTSVKGTTTRRVLEVSLAAAQQADVITITPYKNGVAGKVRTYSVKDYVALAIQQGVKDEVVAAMESMLNYGAMAQKAFNYNISNLANAGMYYAETNPLNNMSVDNLYGIKKKVQTSTNESVLNFSEVNAYLDGTVALRCYLNYTGDVKNLKVTIEGLNCGNDIFEENGKYYVLIDNIPATKFGHQYNIVVTDGTDTVTLKYSVLNYISDCVQYDQASEAQKNTAYAMFLYYARMSEYAKGTVSNKPANCDHKRSYVKNDGTYAEICSDCGKDVTPTNIVENANKLANGVTSYFGTNDGAGSGVVDSLRQNYVVENSNMNFYYPLTNEESQAATITNNAGATYVQDTMDVYVKISDQKYYASNSIKSATANIYRYGYYYYDIHAYGQNFVEDGLTGEPTATQSWATSNLSSVADMSLDYLTLYGSGYFKADVTSTNDPQAYSSRTSKITNTGTHNAMQITMTLESTTNVEVRYVTTSGMGWADAEDAGHILKFDTIADGKEHTYTVYFDEVVDIYGLRFDFNGQEGETVIVKTINFATIKTGSSPELLLDRGLHTYTDKMHQVLSIVAPKQDVKGIQEIGMTTNVTATGVVIVDKNGNKTTSLASDASVSNVAYAGFLTAAGVFGYILPYGDESSIITVKYNGNNSYTITQTIVPENNTIEMQPECNSSSELENYKDTDSSIGTSMNIYNSPTQFYFGQRIYTDTENTFDTFLKEAYIERNPLTANNIKVDTDKTPDATFDGYDGYRGMYAFTIPENIGFNPGYYYAQNFHGAVSFSVKGDSYNRNMYVMAYSYGCSVEGGAVLDGGDILLPIPTEVSKNFNHEFEVPLYLWGDVGYSEVRIPVYVNAGETEKLTVLQTYMNWGQYPLKQISSIQFFAPYYHLSTGVTESNCIANYYVKGKDLQTLPDHRAASAPFWSEETGDTNGDGFKDGDPQHDNGGYHLFLQYTDSAGNKNASEPISSVINSAGLTYADIDMTYRSDDNKIEVTYKHLEMPQTDENRAYYEMKYTVLEDVTISDFDSDFSFYSVYGYGDGYTKFGYYGTSGAVCDKSATTTKSYVLGKECPYFDLYGITGTTGTQNADVSFLIMDHKATTASGKITDDTNFIVNVANGSASLSFNVNGEVTLKAGDTITIYAMIMPWWNQAYRTNSTGAADQNVRDARENTLVNPIVATAVENATVDTSSVFLPTIKSTNGLDATFKLGHATDNANLADMNVTFRVDGFNVLATPKLYEKIGGEWEPVELSSINTPDATGSAHNYDGYFVHYDTNTGKYSYSFVTTISGASSRTFKVVVDDTTVDWKENHSDSYLGAEAIYNAAAYGANMLSTSKVLTENGVTYVTLTNTEAGADSHTSEFKTVGGSAVKYMVVKYRTTTHSTGLQFFMTTAGGSINGTGDFFTLSNSLIDKSGEWKVMVVDLAALDAEKNLTQMVASSVGTYGIEKFRLDPFTNSAANETIDISYIAFTRDVQAAIDMNSDMDVSNISYVYGESKSTAISGKLDELADKTNNNYKNMNVVFSGDSLVDIMTDNNWDADISGATLNDDGTVTVEYGSANDRYFGFTLDGSTTTGKYLVMKYRTGADTNIARGDVNVNVYCLGSTAANRTWTVHTALTKIVADHRWHTLVIDLSDLADVTEVDGSYSVTLFRGDMFDALTPNGSVDFEYIGLCDELSDIALAEDEYLEYSWQNWTASVDTINIDDTPTNTKDSASHTHPSGGAGASDRKAFYEGGKWSWTGGWVAVDGQNLTDLSVCVTDEAGIEHWTKMTYNGTTANVSNTWWEASDITSHALGTNPGNLGYGEGTIGYRVNLAADLSAYYGQTVNVSVRVITGDGYAVTVYSVFVTVPESVKDGYISGEELLGVLNTNQFSGELNGDGSLTITSTVANGDGALTLTTLVEGTPKYAVIKYKTTNPGNQVSLLATTGGLAVGGYSNFTANADGEWHTIVVDITKCERYNYGDEVSFMRLDVCEGAVGCSMTIDHVFLCEDLYDLAGEFVDATYSNNVDYVFVDGANIIGTDTNYRGESSITATVVEYTGWVGVSSFNSTGIVYVVTDEKGIETKVALANSTSEINRYYEDSNITDHLINNTKYSAGTKGYQVHFVADLTEWAGQTVTLSIREIIRGGAIVETYSVEVAIPSNEVKDPELINHPGYISGSDIHNKVNKNWHTSELNSDGSVTITGNGTVNDAYITLTDYAKNLTPKYAIMRYKTTDEGSLTVLASSGSKDAGPYTSCSLITDGEWHTVVVDLTKVTNSGFVYGETVSFLRLDLCEDLGVKQSITIDYVLLCDDSDVPMTLDRNYVSGEEMMGGIQSGFKGTLNDDGSLTVECTGTADGTINFNSLITGTPKYAVIRYKNTDVSRITIYSSTTGGYTEIYANLKTDGMWHVAVVDLESSGQYVAGNAINLVRFDFLDANGDQYVGQSLTLDYVWFTDYITDRVEYEVYDKLDVSFTGKELNNQISTQGLTSNYSTVLNDDGTVTFTKLTALRTEAYFTIKPGAEDVTGRYLIIKYRTTASNLNSTTIFSSTTQNGASGQNNDSASGFAMVHDGMWRVMVVDLAKIGDVKEVDGVYDVNYIRFDAAYYLDAGETIDFAYIGFCDSLADVEAGYDVNFVESTITSNGRVNLTKTEELLTVTSTGDTSDAGRFWITVPESTVTGKYIVVRYKYNATNANNGTLVYLNTWTSTTNSGVTSGDNQKVNVLADGEWHTIVIDATKSGTVNAVDGTYSLKYVGFDFFTTSTAHEGDYVEISYIGFSDSLEDIVIEHGDVEYDLDYQFTNDNNTLGGGTHTWTSSVKTSTSTGGNYTGWATVDGEITGMYYKVVSSTGETEWIECTSTIMGPDHASYSTYNNASGTARTIWLGDGVDIVNAATMTIPASALSGYTSGEVVTIYVAASVDGLNGAYVVLISSEMTIS